MTKIPTKTVLTQNDNTDIIKTRLEIIKLVYAPAYSVFDAVNKAQEIENYVFGRTTPTQDKVKV